MQGNLEKASHISTVLSLILSAVLAISGAVWYLASFENRLRSIEAQVSTIGTGAAIANLLENPGSENQDSYSAINPLWARCDDLVNRTATAIENGRTLTTATELRELMVQLKCDGSRN